VCSVIGEPQFVSLMQRTLQFRTPPILLRGGFQSRAARSPAAADRAAAPPDLAAGRAFIGRIVFAGYHRHFPPYNHFVH
jgi:hypothetical protein